MTTSLPILPSSGAVRADPVGRLAQYSLRVSVIDACNYACPYCAPSIPAAATSSTIAGAVVDDHALVDDTGSRSAKRLLPAEYLRLGRLFRARGVAKVRITGGEPLLRKDVVDVVAAWKEALPQADLALTTNAQRLTADVTRALAGAGLRRLTVHLDTLRADRYASLMSPASSPAAVLAACEAARAFVDDVKLNVVIQRDKNDDEIDAFLALSRDTGMQVRFIELMSTGSADDYARSVFMSGGDIVARAGGVAVPRRHESDPAALFRVAGGAHEGTVFGVIASDTEPFCAHCDRLRLTADGRLRGCLYQSGGIPLGTALRSSASDETLQALLDAALDDKRSWHPLVAPKRVPFSMADIGG